MKIAQIAPLIESVPPRLYGGTERVVSYLTEELVAQGHEVTLFASGDSITAAKLVPCCTQALRLDPAVSDVVPYYMLMLTRCALALPNSTCFTFTSIISTSRCSGICRFRP
jgi:glycosyltransferase involved in cell wall biosynthesis